MIIESSSRASISSATARRSASLHHCNSTTTHCGLSASAASAAAPQLSPRLIHHMAALSVPVEVLPLASSDPAAPCCSSSPSFRSDCNSSHAAASSGRVSLANCRGEVFGHPALLRGRCRGNNSGDRSGNGDRIGNVIVNRRRRRLEVSAIDAAQEFDYEAMKLTELKQKSRLKVGLVGFGNFGQFLAQRFVKQGHAVLAHSRSDYGDIARKLGVTYYRDADDFCEEHPDVVVLCTSILSTESVLQSLPIQRLKRNTLFVDVLSVKEFPRNLFLQVLPAEFDVLCTHPMFGPESGSGSWKGLPFVFEKVRVRSGLRSERCCKFLKIFESEGCRMVEMSCKEHDRHAAGSQFITHTVGRVLGSLGLESTPINTKGYESLLKLVENTYNDSFDLYYGLFLYNVNATEEMVRLERAFDVVKSQLFDKLHGILREQMLRSSSLSDLPKPPARPVQALPAKPATPAEEILDISGRHSASSNNGTSSVLHSPGRQIQAKTTSDSK